MHLSLFSEETCCSRVVVRSGQAPGMMEDEEMQRRRDGDSLGIRCNSIHQVLEDKNIQWQERIRNLDLEGRSL